MGLSHGWGMRRKRSLDVSQDRVPGYPDTKEDALGRLTWVDVVWLGSGHQVCYRTVLVILL